MEYNDPLKKMMRDQDRMDRNCWPFSNTLYTNWDIVLKDEDYSDWYREMGKIRQVRRRVLHPMNRGVFF